MATEADIPDPISLMQRDVVADKELTSELFNTTVNEVPLEEMKKVESSLNQPPEPIEILEKTQNMQAVNGIGVANVNVVNEGNVGTIEGEIFLKSTSVSDEKPKRNTEENQLNTKEELSGVQEEKGCITDKNIILEASYDQDAVVIIQKPDLEESSSMDIENMDNVLCTKTTSIGQDLRETNFEGEEKKSKTSSDSASPANEKIEAATEISEGGKDKFSSSLVTATIEETSSAKAGPDVGDNIEENTSMACEDRSQEPVELSEEMRDVITIEDEVQNKKLESSSVNEVEDISYQKVDNLETSKEESETVVKCIVKESQNEAVDQNDILENIAATDGNPSTTGKVHENPEPKADVSFKKPTGSMRESEDLTPPESSAMECKHEGLMVLAGGDNIADEEQDKIEASKHEEHSAQSFMQINEPAMANLGSPLNAASKEIETTASNEIAETITNIGEQRPVGIPQEILGETREDETIIADDINKNEIPGAKNLSAVELDEKTRCTEVEIPNKNDDELYVTHPPIEETVHVGGEKLDEVSMSESGNQLYEAFEVPPEEEKHVNETYEASKSPESTILEHTSTEGSLNMEATSTRELDINIEKGCELNSEKELKEINAEDNIKEEIKQKEKASDTKIQIATKSDDNEKTTTEEDVPAKNNTPLCTGEEEYNHDQEGRNEPNSSKEASPKLGSGYQSWIMSNETKNINDQIINEEMGEELESTSEREGIEKQVLAEENRLQDRSTVSAGEELGTESPKEDAMTIKMSKEEVLEILQTADENANIGVQIKEEDGTSKDKLVACEGEETKNECSYGKEKELKESDIKVSLTDEDLNAQSITRSSEEETAQKESNLDIVENSSSVPEIFEKGIKEEILEKADSEVTVVAEETSLVEAEAEYKMQVDSSNLVSEEKGLVTTETSEMESNGIDIINKPAEASNLAANEAMEILTAGKHGADETEEKTEPEGKNETSDTLSKTEDKREIATVEKSLDDISEQNLLASSTLSLEQPEIVTPDVSEATGEASEQDKTLYDKAETAPVAESTGKDIMEEEDVATNSKNDTNMEPLEIEKERANDDTQNEDQELYTPPELNNEKSISDSDVELSKRVNTREVANCSEIGKLETLEDEMSSDTGIEKDKTEYTTEVNEVTKGVEAGGGRIDTENAILEQGDPAKNVEGSSKESIEIDKASVEFETEDHSHGSEASETKSISTLPEKYIEKVEHGEHHRSEPDPMAEEESYRRIPETNQTNIAEERYDDENHTTDSTKEKISGQDIQEENMKMNEEIKPKLETQKEIDKTQDTILNEKVPREIERPAETEIIKEQTMEEETVNEVTELDLTSIQSLEATASSNNTEMVKSKVAEDLNQESEASPTRKAMKEDIKKPIEKPVDVSSSVSEVSEEKIKEENIDDTENYDDDTDIAPTVVADVTSLGEVQPNDSSSEAKSLEATKTADTSQQDAEVDSMKIEETSSMVFQLPVHEHEKADNESRTVENLDSNDVEVDKTEIPDTISESKDQGVKEIHETGTSRTVEDTDANEIEKQIREVPEALPQPTNEGVEATSDEQIIAPTVATEVTSLREVQLNDEPVKALDSSSDAKSLEITKTTDTIQQDAEVDRLKLEETSSMVYQLPMDEHEKEDNESITVEKSDANNVEVEETKASNAIPESKDQCVKEIHETGTSLIVGVIDTNEIEKQIGEVPEALSDPKNKGVEAARGEDITLGQTLQAETTEEQLQVPSSFLISKEQGSESETTTTIEEFEDGNMKKDDTQVDNLKLVENSGTVSELPITECESASTVEKSHADEVEAKAIETLDTVSESKDQEFQEIPETRTSPTTENTETDKTEEGVDAVADGEISDHPLLVGKLEEQLQVSSTALNCQTSATIKMDDESTEKDETEVDKIEPGDATGMLSTSPTIEYENADEISAATEKADADADEVQVEEAKTYEAISESKVDNVEEIHETIQRSKDTKDDEDKEVEMLCDSTKDDCKSKEIACPANQKTDEATEPSEAAEDKLGSSLVTAPIEDRCSEKVVQDVGGNLQENSTTACEEGSQETVELSDKMKDVTSIEDEVQNKNLETSFVKKVEDACFPKADDLDTSKEEFETGMKDIVNESQNEVDNQNEILENIVTSDTSLSTTGKDDETTEPKTDVSFRKPNESMMRESEDLTPTEALTMECKHEGVMVVAGEDNIVAEEQDKPETSNHEENSTKSFMQETEPVKANQGSPLDVASEEIQATSNEFAETITNIEEQRPVGIPQEILGETRKDEIIIADDINNNENPEAQNLSTVDLDEKTRSTEVDIPNKNGNELYVTYPPIEETVQVRGEKQDEVSMLELGDQLHEAFEVPMEEEKHVNETSELDNNLEKGCEQNSEKAVKEINAEESTKEEMEEKEKASDTEIQIATKSDDNEKSTIEGYVPVKNNTPLCTGEEEYHHDQEGKHEPNSSMEASTELDSGDQSCRTSNETKNVNDQIIKEKVSEEYETTRASTTMEESANRKLPSSSVGEENVQENKTEAIISEKEASEEYETFGASKTMEESAMIDLPSSSVEEEKVQENFKEDKTEAMISKKEASEEYETIGTSMTMEENAITDLPSSSVREGNVQENYKENKTKAMISEKAVSEEYEIVGASTTIEESSIIGLPSSSVGEEKVQENFKEDKTKALRLDNEASEECETSGEQESAITNVPSSSIREDKVQENLKENKIEVTRSKKEANDEFEVAGASTTMEESAIIELPASSVGKEKVQENIKEDKTKAMRSEKETSEEYETVGASTTMKESATVDLSSFFGGEEKVKEGFKEDKIEAVRSEKEASEEYEIVGASTTTEKSTIVDLSSSSVGEEKLQKNLKEDETEAMKLDKEASKEYKTAGASTTIRENAIIDLSSSSIGEEKVQEGFKEDKTEAKRIIKEASEEYEIASTIMEESAIKDLPSSSIGEEKAQEIIKEDKIEAMQSEKEESEEYENVGASTIMEESAITNLPSSSVGEEEVRENIKEDKTEAMRSEKEATEEYEIAEACTTMEESAITDLPFSSTGEEKVQKNFKEDEIEAMRSKKEASEEYETARASRTMEESAIRDLSFSSVGEEKVQESVEYEIAGASTTVEESAVTDLPSSTVGEEKVQENNKEDKTEEMRSKNEASEEYEIAGASMTMEESTIAELSSLSAEEEKVQENFKEEKIEAKRSEKEASEEYEIARASTTIGESAITDHSSSSVGEEKVHDGFKEDKTEAKRTVKEASEQYEIVGASTTMEKGAIKDLHSSFVGVEKAQENIKEDKTEAMKSKKEASEEYGIARASTTMEESSIKDLPSLSVGEEEVQKNIKEDTTEAMRSEKEATEEYEIVEASTTMEESAITNLPSSFAGEEKVQNFFKEDETEAMRSKKEASEEYETTRASTTMEESAITDLSLTSIGEEKVKEGLNEDKTEAMMSIKEAIKEYKIAGPSTTMEESAVTNLPFSTIGKEKVQENFKEDKIEAIKSEKEASEEYGIAGASTTMEENAIKDLPSLSVGEEEVQENIKEDKTEAMRLEKEATEEYEIVEASTTMEESTITDQPSSSAGEEKVQENFKEDETEAMGSKKESSEGYETTRASTTMEESAIIDLSSSSIGKEKVKEGLNEDITEAMTSVKEAIEEYKIAGASTTMKESAVTDLPFSTIGEEKVQENIKEDKKEAMRSEKEAREEYEIVGSSTTMEESNIAELPSLSVEEEKLQENFKEEEIEAMRSEKGASEEYETTEASTTIGETAITELSSSSVGEEKVQEGFKEDKIEAKRTLKEASEECEIVGASTTMEESAIKDLPSSSVGVEKAQDNIKEDKTKAKRTVKEASEEYGIAGASTTMEERAIKDLPSLFIGKEEVQENFNEDKTEAMRSEKVATEEYENTEASTTMEESAITALPSSFVGEEVQKNFKEDETKAMSSKKEASEEHKTAGASTTIGESAITDLSSSSVGNEKVQEVFKEDKTEAKRTLKEASEEYEIAGASTTMEESAIKELPSSSVGVEKAQENINENKTEAMKSEKEASEDYGIVRASTTMEESAIKDLPSSSVGEEEVQENINEDKTEAMRSEKEATEDYEIAETSTTMEESAITDLPSLSAAEEKVQRNFTEDETKAMRSKKEASEEYEIAGASTTMEESAIINLSSSSVGEEKVQEDLNEDKAEAMKSVKEASEEYEIDGASTTMEESAIKDLPSSSVREENAQENIKENKTEAMKSEEEASEEYGIARASTTMEERAIKDLSLSIVEELVQENIKEKKTEAMRSEKEEATKESKIAETSTTMEESAITDLPSLSTREEKVQKNYKEDETKAMRSKKEASEEYETAGASTTMEESAIINLLSSSVGEEKVQEGLNEDKTEEMKSVKEASEEYEIAGASTIMEESAIKDLPASSVGVEKAQENIKEDKTETMKSKKEASEGYEIAGASTTMDESVIKDLPSSSFEEEEFKENINKDKTEAMRLEKEATEEYEVAEASTTMEGSAITNLPSSSAGEEKVQNFFKEDETEAMRSKKEASKEYETATTSTTMEESAIRDLSSSSVGEENVQEGLNEDKTEAMTSVKEAIKEYKIAGASTTMEESAVTDLHFSTIGEEKVQENFKEDKTEAMKSKKEASGEYEIAGASTTMEESAIKDLPSSYVGEEKAQENIKEDKTEAMKLEKEASKEYETATASTTMEESAIRDLSSSSVGEENVQEGLNEDKTEAMTSVKEAIKEYKIAGASTTMEESAVTDLHFSTIGEEKVQENFKEDKTEAMKSKKEASREYEIAGASTTMEESAIKDLPSSYVGEEKAQENIKEDKTEAMKLEKEASEEYEIARASTTMEESAITNLLSSSTEEEKVQENYKEEKTNAMRSKKEASEEYEPARPSTTIEKSAIIDLSSSSVGEEKVQDGLKVDKTEALRIVKEASEEYEIVGATTTMEESAIKDLPSSSVREEKAQENIKEGKTEAMESEKKASEEYEIAGASTTMEKSAIPDIPSSSTLEENIQDKFKEDKTEAMRSEKEASEEYDTAGACTTMEENAITDFYSSFVGEEKVQDNFKKEKTEAMISSKEVRYSNIECIEQDFVTTLSTKEREANALRDDTETNEGLIAQSITRSSEEETAKKESKLDIVENSSSVLEISKKEIKEEILEKIHSETTVVTEETSLMEADAKHKMQVDSSDMVSEEKGLLTTEASETESNGVYIIAKSAETSNLGENKDIEIPTARKHGADEAAEKTELEGENETCDTISKPEDQREIAIVETSLDDLSEKNLQASPTLSLEEHNFLMTGVSETTGEALEKDKTLYGKAETPVVAETPEEDIKKEDESTNPKNDTNMGPLEIEKESANDDAQKEDQESYNTPIELNNEKSIYESNAELLKSINTSEVPDRSEIGKLETLEDAKLSDTRLEKDKADYEMVVNEASKGIEVSGGCIYTEKSILEQEDSAKNFEESFEIKKAQVEFEAGGHSHGTEASETKRISTLAGKVPWEIETAAESEIIKEQTTEEEICTKEPQTIAVADKMVTDPDLTPIQSLETTDSNNNTELAKSKVAEDLNQESEASPMMKALTEEIKKPIEKPVEVSSSVSEVSEENIKEKNIEDAENCDDDTNIAPTVVTDVTSLGEAQLNDEPAKALGTSSETKSLETTKPADTSQQDAEVDSMKLEETSSLVSQFPILEHRKADDESITVKKSDANDVDAEGTKIPDAVSESKDRVVKEIHETGTSLTVGETDTNEIDKQIREVPEALSEPINQGVETATDDEIIAPTVATEVTSMGEVQLIDEPVKALDSSSETKSLETTNTADTCQQDKEVSSPKETSSMMFQLPIQEHEKAGNESITVEKLDANDVEVEEPKISDAVPESKDQCVKEIHETGTSLTMGETDANEIEKQIRKVSEALSEPINQGAEAARDDEITPGQTLQAEKTEEQLQVPSSFLTSKEQDSETATTIEKSEDGSTNKDDTQVDNLKLVENSGMVSELPITQCESANNETVEKSDTDVVEAKETEDTILYEKVPREIERSVETEIIKEQITEEENCAKELHMIPVDDETVNEVTELDLTSIQSLEATASSNNTEMVKSKVAEDLNQESEASPMTKAMKEDIEKPVDISSLVSEVSEEKIKEENIEDTENCDDDTDIAPTVVADATSLREVQLNDTSSEAKSLEATKTPNTSQQDEEVNSMKIEETSSMVFQLPVHEQEKADNESRTVENSDANDVLVDETEIPDTLSESKDQGVKEIQETGTSLTVEENDANEIEKQIGEVPEALPQPMNEGIEAPTDEEIIAPTVATEVTSWGKVQLNDEPVKVLDTSSDAKSIETTKTADTSQQNAEVDNLKLEETSSMVYQLPMHEHDKADNQSITVEKSDANCVEVDETKIPETVPESKDQGVKDIHETGTSLTVGVMDTNEIEEQIGEVPEALSEPINQGVEVSRDDEIAPGQTLQAEKIEEQFQVPSSSLISKEQDSESTATIKKSEDGSTKKDDTQFDNLKLVENSGMVSHLPITEGDSANNETVEKSDADEVEVKETKTLDAVSESKDRGFEEIHETGTIPTTENAETDKIEEEITEANEKISDPRHQGVEAFDGETLDHPPPLGKLQEQLQVSSSALSSNKQDSETTTTIERIEDESTKETETEVEKIELVEATDMLSKLPTIEHKNADMSATIEKADAESKTSEAISESKVHGVEEIHEIGPSLTVGKIHTDKVQEEIKAAPDTIFEPNYQCVEAVIDGDITINQTLPTQRNDQFQEPSSALPKEQNHETTTNVELIQDDRTKKDETQLNENVACSFATTITEKPSLQDEGLRKHDVSNLELKVQESQNRAPEVESTALEETSAVEPHEYIPEKKCADCPTEYEILPIQCSSQGTSKNEDIIDSGNSNKEAVNLPPPYPTIKELLQGEVGEKCEEASNLEFEKTANVLESVSEIQSPEVPPISERIDIIKEQHKGVVTELKDGENQSAETTEADEAIKKDTSKEKAINEEEHKQITEKKPVARNSHPVSPREEIVTKSNQEDELRAEDYPGEMTNTTFETTKNEIQHEVMFEESEEVGADKNVKETITIEDRTLKDPNQVSVGDGTASVSPPEEAKDGKNVEKAPNRLDLENQGDETNFRDAATVAMAPIKEFKSSEVTLVSHEEDRTGDNDEETVMRSVEQLQNTDLAVPPVTDAAAEEAPDEIVGENFEEVSEPAPEGPTHGTIETYEENKETASADTNNSENLMDNEKLKHRFLEPACEESGVTEDMSLKEQEVSADTPSISSCITTSQEKTADTESEKTVHKKQDDFVSEKQRTEAVSIIEGKSIQVEEDHTKNEEPVELSTMGNGRKPDEAKINSTNTANEDEETQHQNEKPNVLSHIKDSSSEVSHEKGITDLDQITKDTQDLEKTSIAISHEQIARKANQNESAETTNSTASKDVPQMQDDPTAKVFQNAEVEDLKAGCASGSVPEAKKVECGEEKRMGEETTEKSTMIEPTKLSLSDLLQRSTKQTLQVVENLTEERELMGNKEEPQTETAERVQVEAAKTDEEKDEEEEGDEHQRADSGSDAPVMVEASTDMDVKIAHKKSHNILSGVGSKVKHSLAKMKKVITGKSSHPKTPPTITLK